MKFLVAVSVFVLAVLVYQSNGMCNTCSSTTNKACVTKDSYRFCGDGEVLWSSTPIICDPGTICTTSGPKPCVPEGDVEPSCVKCNACNAGMDFACTDYNKFSLCLGIDTPDKTQFTCPNNLVCNIGASNICVENIGGTCPWKDIITPTADPSITTTPSAQKSPNEFCEQKNKPGRFEVSDDLTCKIYISCVASTAASAVGGWLGGLYQCPKNTFFNPSTTMCGKEPPTRCKPAQPQ